MKKEELITLNEAEKLSRLSRYTISIACRRGLIEHVRADYGTRKNYAIRVRRARLMSYLAAREKGEVRTSRRPALVAPKMYRGLTRSDLAAQALGVSVERVQRATRRRCVLSKKRQGRVFVCLDALREYFETGVTTTPDPEPEVWCCVPRHSTSTVFSGSQEQCIDFRGTNDFLIIREDQVADHTGRAA